MCRVLIGTGKSFLPTKHTKSAYITSCCDLLLLSLLSFCILETKMNFMQWVWSTFVWFSSETKGGNSAWNAVNAERCVLCVFQMDTIQKAVPTTPCFCACWWLRVTCQTKPRAGKPHAKLLSVCVLHQYMRNITTYLLELAICSKNVVLMCLIQLRLLIFQYYCSTNSKSLVEVIAVIILT